MTLKLRREHYVRLYLEVNSVLKNQDAGTKILDEFPRPTCRSVYTVSDKRLRHGGSGYETTSKRRRVQQHTTRTLQRDGGTNWQLQSSQEDLPLEPRVVSRTCDATVQSCTTEVLARYIARLSEQVN